MFLCQTADKAKMPRMNDTPMTREERLAAKLRENLRRRKAQSRAIPDPATEYPDETSPQSGESGGGALSKGVMKS